MRRAVATCAVALSLIGCGDWTEAEDGLTEADHALIATMVAPTQAPPDPTNRVSGNPSAAALGHLLFFDTTLSNPPGVSCATCHDPQRAFSDSRDSNNVSRGVDGADGGAQFTLRNAPGLLDVATYQWWGWDGRSDSLWMHCSVAFESAATMAGARAASDSRAVLANALVGQKYAAPYLDAFTSTKSNFATPPLSDTQIELLAADGYKAMAAYLEQLIGAASAFDLFASGQSDALTAGAQNGLKLFLGKGGCITCHNGPSFNGAVQATTGEDFFKSVGVAQTGYNVPPTDNGRFGAVPLLVASIYNSGGAFNDMGVSKISGLGTPPADDEGRFRIKSLRNAARTAPYMHAGQIATLGEVVHFYNSGGDGIGYSGVRDHQLGPINFTDDEEDDVVAFLLSLTEGDPPSNLLCDPAVAGCTGTP